MYKNKEELLERKAKIEGHIPKIEKYISMQKDEEKKKSGMSVLKQQKNILNGINVTLETIEFYK